MRFFHWPSLKNNWPLIIILLIYVTITIGHSIVAPLTSGNDEWAHFRYVRFIAEYGRLPGSLAERDEAAYKSDAPPLYHLLVSAVTSNVEPTRLLRPLDSPRRQLADNTIDSYALVHNAYELFPYRGEVLLWHLGRGLSILFGLATIGLTYLTSLELFPSRRRALAAAALLAFMPAFIFHSSVLSYESLSAMLSGLFLLISIKAIKRPAQWRWWLALGALAGLALTTKYSAVLLPLEIIFVAWLASRRVKGESANGELHGRRSHFSTRLFAYVLAAGLVMVLTVSWWFGFVVWNFNTIKTQGPWAGVLQPLLVGDASDTTSVKVATALFGQEAVQVEPRAPLDRDYLQLLYAMSESFWAAPVAGQFVASPWLALLFSLAALFGLAGLWLAWQKAGTTARIWLMLLVFHTLLIAPLLLLRILFSFDPRETAQGRHLLLPAASAIPILLIWGWAQWSPKISQIYIASLLLWSVLGQLGWAAVTYPPPIPVWTEQPPEMAAACSQPVSGTFAEGMQLNCFTWRKTPGAASLEVTLWWESLALMSEDYLVELSLLDQAGNVASYSLSHPVQGRYPTRAWEPGDVIKDLHWLPLVGSLDGVYRLQLRLLNREAQPLADDKTLLLAQINLAPETYKNPAPCQIWYQGQPDRFHPLARTYRVRSPFTIIGPELPILTPLAGELEQLEQKPLLSVAGFHLFIAGPDWSEAYRVADSVSCPDILVDVPARDFSIPDIPQPLEVNFNDQAQLLGYELPARHIQAGGRLPLTLYWQALDYIGHDYRIFDNLLDEKQRRWGGYDRRPRDGYSTLLWVPGQVITDAFGVPVDPAAPDGVYTLDIGLYHQTEAGAVSLPLIVAGQPVEQNSIQLGPIKVGGPPPGLTTNTPTPQITLNQPVGHQITLLGYDLTDQNDQPIQNPKHALERSEGSKIQNLKVVLYWQANASPQVDYTTFLHLRDASNQTVAQKDSPPANGRYPTSLWGQGEIIVDEISLSLDNLPLGRYIPTIGLYNFVSGERLPVPGNPAHEIPLEAVEIR